MRKHFTGFTLIEVLLALSIIAIALTALIKASSQQIIGTQQIKDKLISHWVAMQGVTAIQLNLLPIKLNQDITQITTLLGQRWYWRAKLSPTEIQTTQQIRITVSRSVNGPFTDELIAYQYAPENMR